MKTKPLLIVFSLVLGSFMLMAGRARAAGPTGITVSPAFQMVTIQAGASSQPVSFKITNNRPVAQELSFSVQDFNTLNESGGLFFVGTNPTALQKKYGLAKWFSLPETSQTLQPHQTFTFNAAVLNLPDLSGGGHYGALMISLGGGPANGRIGLQPIASSLLFVTKPQGAVYSLGLSNVYFKHSLTTLPKAVTLRFQNTGNTHVVPRGSVYINNPHGELVSKGIINENSDITLPGTFRRYTVALNKVGSNSAAGAYKLHVDFRFDGYNQYRSYQKKLWYIPAGTAVILGALIIILIIAIIRIALLKRTAVPKK